MKFRVGQRVRIIGTKLYFNRHRGKVGIIDRVDPSTTWAFNVDMGKDSICADENEIELLIPIGQQLLFGFMESKHDEV